MFVVNIINIIYFILSFLIFECFFGNEFTIGMQSNTLKRLIHLQLLLTKKLLSVAWISQHLEIKICAI